jgi:HAD superfamily hydrolase (TIGR01450 family)
MTAEPATARPDTPRASDRSLAEIYDVALLDLDGVVYLSARAVPGAAEALAEARHRGMRLAFVTNNASRSPSTIAAQLTGLGVPATPDEVVTSAHAAARLIADRLPAGSPVLVVGGIGLRLALRERGLRPVSTAAERPAAVVQGYGPGISYGLLAEGSLAVRAGAWFVASNADVTLPTSRGLQPGNGSLVQVIAVSTGRQPVVAGKPEPPLHAEAVARSGARRPLVVGDRLDTDIEGAVRAGADSMLVLTGVSGPADAVLAPPQQRPTYLAHDLAGLIDPHPEVQVNGAAFTCGGWTARLTPAAAGSTDGAGPDGAGPDGAGPDGAGPDAASAGADGGGPDAASAGADGGARPGTASAGDADRQGGPGAGPPARLELDGEGSAIDGLRALCAAAWSAPGPVLPESVHAAVAHLRFPPEASATPG